MPENDSAMEFFSDDHYLQELRAQMLRFAELQLADAGAAEDAVQEAMMGALKNARSFAGGAAFKTWVFAILKHKITDHLRKQQRLVNSGSIAFEEEDQDPIEALFNHKGYWHLDERPAPWGDPEAALHNGHFWKVFEACLEHLPPKQARVFMMREFIGLSSDEICVNLSLSVTNLHVLLHRARLMLRECLENHWFQKGAG
jgi:RNA polymerase sigma-70 factor (ECF subfamily)